jgi:hypothetical protein
LNASRGKKVTVSTFTSPPPSLPPYFKKSASGSQGKDDVIRIAANQTISLPDFTNCRRWQDPRVEPAIYVPLPQKVEPTSATGQKARSRKQRKGDGAKLDDKATIAGPSTS